MAETGEDGASYIDSMDHIPVMIREVIHYLGCEDNKNNSNKNNSNIINSNRGGKRDKIYVDATFGNGGHTRESTY